MLLSVLIWPVVARFFEPDLVVCGSTTVNDHLAQALFRSYLGAENAAVRSIDDGATTIIESTQSTARDSRDRSLRVEIRAQGSEAGIEELQKPECDLVFLSRELKSEEKAILANARVL